MLICAAILGERGPEIPRQVQHILAVKSEQMAVV
jgi:hypothetical protein